MNTREAAGKFQEFETQVDKPQTGEDAKLWSGAPTKISNSKLSTVLVLIHQDFAMQHYEYEAAMENHGKPRGGGRSLRLCPVALQD